MTRKTETRKQPRISIDSIENAELTHFEVIVHRNAALHVSHASEAQSLNEGVNSEHKKARQGCSERNSPWPLPTHKSSCDDGNSIVQNAVASTSTAVDGRLNVKSAEFVPKEYAENIKSLKDELSCVFMKHLRGMTELANQLRTHTDEERKAIFLSLLIN